MSDSFVYCWTDHKFGKLYVGVHKGGYDDGYVCSSKTMLQEYKTRPNDFTREILADGLWDDILKLEAAILISVNAAKSPSFYNLHNSNGKFYCNSKGGTFEHSPETKKRMSATWKSRSVWNCDNKKAISAWRGKKHSDNALEKITEHNRSLSKESSERMLSNNPMKNQASINKMLDSRKRNRELRNVSSNL